MNKRHAVTGLLWGSVTLPTLLLGGLGLEHWKPELLYIWLPIAGLQALAALVGFALVGSGFDKRKE